MVDTGVAIVTGAGRGIGRAVATELAARGMPVALVARSVRELDETAAEIRRGGGKASVLPADVSDADAVATLVETTERELGPVSLLVNNAGLGLLGLFVDQDPKEWWRVLQVNLGGTAFFASSVLRHMVPRGRGTIVNVASNGGIRPFPNASAYAASKAGVLRLTDTLAEELAGTGISVFAISPGVVHTAMTDNEFFADIPEDRWQTPEMTARLVAELAGGRADRLSGRYIHVLDDLDELIAGAATIEENGLYQLGLHKLHGREA